MAVLTRINFPDILPICTISHCSKGDGIWRLMKIAGLGVSPGEKCLSYSQIQDQ